MITKPYLLDKIKEHCNYCPEDLEAVIKALVSVQDKLDYSTQEQLEELIRRYALAWAQVYGKTGVGYGDNSGKGYEELIKRLPLSDIAAKIPPMPDEDGDYDYDESALVNLCTSLTNLFNEISSKASIKEAVLPSIQSVINHNNQILGNFIHLKESKAIFVSEATKTDDGMEFPSDA